MPSLKAALANELLLLLYRRKTIVFTAVSAVLPILLAASLHSLQPLLGLVAVSASFPVEMLDFYTIVWIPLFIFLTAADLFPNEVSARTLKLALLRPITRFQVYLAKNAALMIAIGANLFILGAVSMVCSLAAGSPVTNGTRMIAAYLAAFVAMSVLSAVFIFISQFFKSASGCLIFSIVLYAAAKLAPLFVRRVSAFSPVSYTDWHQLWLSPAVSSGKLAVTLLFLVSSCVLFFALGYFIFDRKQV